jgi:putative endonuclease
MWGVYILESLSTGHLYTGATNNPKRRVCEHNNSSKGAKRTRAGKPWILVYWEPFNTQGEALHREYLIQQMNRKEKLHLLNNPRLNHLLSLIA